MGVPEAAVNEEGSFPLGKNKVGLAREVRVDAEAKAACVKATAQHQLGLCILPLDAGHHPAAYRFRNYVSHGRLGASAPAVLPVRSTPA
jgi:hypothetical protein